MYLHFYLRSGIVYIPTVGKMDKGFYRDIEPVTEVAVADTKMLHDTISAALTSGNPAVPIPPRHNWPAPVVLKLAGVKSWTSFERGMKLWGIEERDGIFSIIGKEKKPDGTTVDDPKQTISFPNGTETGKIADRMVAILQEAVPE
jgi:hypothetical protein